MPRALVLVVVALASPALVGVLEEAQAEGLAVTSGVGDSGIVLAGERILLPARSSADPLLRSFSLNGGPPAPVGSRLDPPARGPGFAYSFDASESTVALIRYREDADGGDLDAQPYAGPLGGQLTALAEAVRVGGYLGFHESVAVSGRATLLQRNGLTQTMLSVHEPGRPERPLPSFPGQVVEASIAGDLVAFSVRRRPNDLGEEVRRLIVVNWRSGQVRYDRKLRWDIQGLDLAPDGRVVASAVERRGFRLALVDPVGNARILARAKRAWLVVPRFAGSRIAAIRHIEGRPNRERIVAVAPNTGAIADLSPRSARISTFDADTHGVAWIANDCALATSADGPQMRVIPAGPCLRDELSLRGRPTGLHGRRIVVDLYCHTSATGVCQGILQLRLKRKGSALARRAFRVRSEARQKLVLRISRATHRRLWRMIRRHGRNLVANAVIHDVAGREGTFSDHVRIRKRRRP